MSLIERLEAEIRKQDRKVTGSAADGSYNFVAADLRDLLEEALRHIKAEPPAYMEGGNWMTREVYERIGGFVTRS